MKIWTGHDHPPEERDELPWVSVQEHRWYNKHLNDGVTEDGFVALIMERDAKMSEPRLLHPSCRPIYGLVGCLPENVNVLRLKSPAHTGDMGERL